MRHTMLQMAFAGFVLVLLLVPGLTALADDKKDNEDRCEDVTVDLDERRVDARVGEEFSYEIDIDGEADDVDVRHSDLPEGLSFDEDGLEISGTPEEDGLFRVDITAENKCSDDSATLRIDVEEERENGEANVTVTSTLSRSDGSYVHLSQIPYTGFGENLKLSLIIMALMLWSGALAFLFLGERERTHLRGLFFSLFAGKPSKEQKVLIDRSIDSREETDEQDTGVSTAPDATLLQKLRNYAYEEKVLMTESALSMLVGQADNYGKDSNALLTETMEEAKARYPREDGLLKIDTARLTEVFSELYESGTGQLRTA